MQYTHGYPFSAVVGQEPLKLGLILNIINPRVGGILIRGEKGTAKSTTVRALAALLPMIKVNKGCALSCDPYSPHGVCDFCRNSPNGHGVTERPTRVVTLPLNATEDRVVGGIDFNLAVKKGVRAFLPGLLAKAHRGILYVDEVNLLDDHIVDIILDAAASKGNRIEREGLSFFHTSDFILAGTMNPEEGELRPQLLDRFGLCVEVEAENDMEKRALLMERKEAFDADPLKFSANFRLENEKISARILSAQRLLKDVKIHSSLRPLISSLCSENNVAGHRADLVMEQAVRAYVAYDGRKQATVEDVGAVAGFALLHRKRDTAPPPPPEHKHEKSSENNQDQNREHEKDQDKSSHDSREASPKDGDDADSGKENNEPESSPENGEDSRGKEASLSKIFDVGETFKVKKIVTPKDRILRRGSGRRSCSRVAEKQGRYVKSTTLQTSGDIAFDATLRAAAPFQLRRDGKNGLAIQLRKEDLREKVREKRIGNFLLFLVDASGSMGARGRMVASKGAVMSLLLDAYQKRDKVGLVSFRKEEAVVNLPSTSSVELAGKLLQEMPVGGKTPLSAGLVKGFELLSNHLVREPASRPMAIIITDGKGNVALGEKKPVQEVFDLALKMAMEDRIQFIVVDSENNGPVSFGLARKLAANLNANYFKIDDLKANQLLDIVKGVSR
jgi:magnesium chelatase subunit D